MINQLQLFVNLLQVLFRYWNYISNCDLLVRFSLGVNEINGAMLIYPPPPFRNRSTGFMANELWFYRLNFLDRGTGRSTMKLQQ